MMISMGLGLSSCKEERPDPSYFAGIAAKGYYDLLLEGKYEEYVYDKAGGSLQHTPPTFRG